ncbi:MAG: type sorting protein, partial [Mucilaginibacter sp.]|nr:type sorting protein [Mucilaginibacter sp.]
SQVVEVMMSDNGNSDMVHIYPNPAVNVINLNVTGKTTGNTSYDILVTNSSGLIVKQATSAQLNWQANVADLLPGTYLVKVLDKKDKSLLGQTKFVKL